MEDSPAHMLIAPHSPGATVTKRSMSISQALTAFAQ
jgi:hypothetical protein